MDAALLAVILLIAGAAGVAAWRPAVSERARMRRRLKGLAAAFSARSAADGGGEPAVRRRLIQGKLRELERQRQRSRHDTLRHLILQSGLPLTLRSFLAVSAGVGALTGLAVHLGGMPLPVSAVAAAGAGLLPPRLALRIAIRRRQARFALNFADALDVLVRGVRSGLPVGECLRIVAREAPDPVGPEFRFLTESQRLGMTLKQALDRSVERMPVTELQFFAIVLLIQQQTGGNLAGTLEKLSGVLRARKRLRDKVAALSSEAKASAGIIGALPFLVAGGLALVNPEYIALLYTERVGNVMLVGGLLWMAIGVAVMHRMIDFEA